METVENILRDMRDDIEKGNVALWADFGGETARDYVARLGEANEQMRRHLAKANFSLGRIPLVFRHTDKFYNGETVTYKIHELLNYINADHSDGWADYEVADWEEGMANWSDLIIDWDLTKAEGLM